MEPGARRKFGAPMFEPEVFQKQMYCIEKSACDIVGLSAPPLWFGTRGIVPSLPPQVTPYAPGSN